MPSESTVIEAEPTAEEFEPFWNPPERYRTDAIRWVTWSFIGWSWVLVPFAAIGAWSVFRWVTG